MVAVGIVSEYNPLHDGHRFMMKEIRRLYGQDTAIVCLMSGDFVQRGEPAVYEKHLRAKIALEAGADLVLELPFPYSTSVAEHFSRAAVEIFNKIGIIDHLAFGSEGKNTQELSRIAENLSSPAFHNAEEKMKKAEPTLSFPRRRDAAYLALYRKPLALSSNEILGIGYLSAIKNTCADFDATALPMLNGMHASNIRTEIYKSECDYAALAEGESAVLGILRLKDDQRNRFVNAAKYSTDLSSLFAAVRTGGDTDARLKRELLHTLLNTPKDAEKKSPLFTVLLGANDVGQKLLSSIRTSKKIEIVTKQGRGCASSEGKEQFALYQRAEGFYPTFMKNPVTPAELMAEKPIILKKHLHS